MKILEGWEYTKGTEPSAPGRNTSMTFKFSLLKLLFGQVEPEHKPQSNVRA